MAQTDSETNLFYCFRILILALYYYVRLGVIVVLLLDLEMLLMG